MEALNNTDKIVDNIMIDDDKNIPNECKTGDIPEHEEILVDKDNILVNDDNDNYNNDGDNDDNIRENEGDTKLEYKEITLNKFDIKEENNNSNNSKNNDESNITEYKEMAPNNANMIIGEGDDMKQNNNNNNENNDNSKTLDDKESFPNTINMDSDTYTNNDLNIAPIQHDEQLKQENQKKQKNNSLHEKILKYKQMQNKKTMAPKISRKKIHSQNALSNNREYTKDSNIPAVNTIKMLPDQHKQQNKCQERIIKANSEQMNNRSKREKSTAQTKLSKQMQTNQNAQKIQKNTNIDNACDEMDIDIDALDDVKYDEILNEMMAHVSSLSHGLPMNISKDMLRHLIMQQMPPQKFEEIKNSMRQNFPENKYTYAGLQNSISSIIPDMDGKEELIRSIHEGAMNANNANPPDFSKFVPNFMDYAKNKRDS